MRRPARTLLVGSCSVIFGCSVLKRADDCVALSEAMRDFEPRLAAELPAEPSEQALTSKADLYRQLAERLRGLDAKDAKVEKHKDALVAGLNVVQKELLRAASAVRAAEKEVRERQTRKERALERRLAAQKTNQEDAKQLGSLRDLNPPKAPPRSLGSASPSHRSKYETAKQTIEKQGDSIAQALRQLGGACR